MSSKHRSMAYHAGTGAAQRGVVLVIALIFLLLLTILAVGASNRSLLQERMAGGLLDAQRAQMSAQTALRGAEWTLFVNAATVGATPCGLIPSCYEFSPPITDVVNFRTKPGWVTAGSAEYLGLDGTLDFTATANGKLADNPRYIVEHMSRSGGGPVESGASSEAEPTVDMYRVTARATGGSGNTVSVLQSTFEVVR